MFVTLAETFKPLELIPHEPQSRIPDNIALNPLSFFSLFSNDHILSQIVQATNAYADLKREGRQDGG